ncbi:energy transducer TonB [Hymenobacter sp. PAMC 26628]|uniref:energy transducer TonB n=1 Tax=Hymenobacter sp. PAMC 26628 TaxID=1484118 RepID=UPI0012FFC0F1|nr:energy transducer TonB [Hymenobacter sp. PAMC 26628]
MKEVWEILIVSFCGLILWPNTSQGQTLQSSVSKDTIVVADGPYVYVDSMPSLSSDQNLSNAKKEIRIHNAIQKGLVYPADFKPINKPAKVFVRFMVARDGRITDVVPMPAFDKRLNNACLEAAAAAVRTLGTLNPGIQKGRAVPVGITTGIDFGKEAN